jgi:hypothetical protein
MDESPFTGDAAVLQLLKTVRALLIAFPESLEQSQSLDAIDATNLADFVQHLEGLRAADNGVYMSVAVAAMIVTWASRQRGRTPQEILDLLSNELDLGA